MHEASIQGLRNSATLAVLRSVVGMFHPRTSRAHLQKRPLMHLNDVTGSEMKAHYWPKFRHSSVPRAVCRVL